MHMLLPESDSKYRSPGELHAMLLRACYAMSGTDVAYAAMVPCTCYAMSGYEISGTDWAYNPTRTQYVVLRGSSTDWA
eukprot:3920213-Rhodomonas_salina.3